MPLVKNYYTISSSNITAQTGVFDIRLLKEAEVYKGHFPDEPISPGVCNVQMMRECAEQVVGHKLPISTLSKCRFVKLISPTLYPEIQIVIDIISTTETEVKWAAKICSKDTVLQEMKVTSNRN
ncbi:MAG: hypothetical protein IJS73_04170 [Paludibacteraceae bacterium]|nr:hypothetical protein [Paludibacteraceae bacterium]